MKLRFTRTAARQLDQVLIHIAEENPQGARRVRERVRVVMDLLLQYPFAGQSSDRVGIRRVVATPYPYIISYRVADGVVVIRSVRHAARRPLVQKR